MKEFSTAVKNICDKYSPNGDSMFDIYRYRVDVISAVKREIKERNHRVSTAEWMAEIASCLGVSTQTLYLSKAAMKAYEFKKEPPKYASFPYSKIKKLKR